jgi:hypothetical protein
MQLSRHHTAMFRPLTDVPHVLVPIGALCQRAASKSNAQLATITDGPESKANVRSAI